MIHPSYTELMAVINSEVEEGEQPLVQSRYSIVKATANRAKEIIDARSVEEKIAKARIEASNKEKEKEKAVKSVGFIAHMDTTPDASGTSVRPWVLENYDGGDICLNKEKDIWLLTSDFPEMKNYKGKSP